MDTLTEVKKTSINIAKYRLYLPTYHEPLAPDIPHYLVFVHELDELLQQVGAHLLAVLLAPLLLDHIQHLTKLVPCTHTNHVFNYLPPSPLRLPSGCLQKC